MKLEIKQWRLGKPKNREKRIKKVEQGFRKLWDTTKNINVCVMGVSEGENKVNEAEKYYKEKWRKTSKI